MSATCTHIPELFDTPSTRSYGTPVPCLVGRVIPAFCECKPQRNSVRMPYGLKRTFHSCLSVIFKLDRTRAARRNSTCGTIWRSVRHMLLNISSHGFKIEKLIVDVSLNIYEQGNVMEQVFQLSNFTGTGIQNF